eukprot:m.39728 g.39728  ORF g.39728 m.39728 type:complete len:504 (-) comp10346_c0_seq4:56-1567(-)
MADISYVRRHKNTDLALAVIAIVSDSVTPRSRETEPVEKEFQATKHGYEFCSWHKRVFKLSANKIDYLTRGGKHKGSIELSPYCLAQPVELNDKKATNCLAYVRIKHQAQKIDRVSRKHGTVLFVPEIDRSYYIHFSDDTQRSAWLDAINTNIEVLRRREGMLDEMADQVKQVFGQSHSASAESGVAMGRVKMAIRNRFNPLITDATDGLTQCFRAIQTKGFEQLEQLIQSDPSLVKRMSESGNTALLKAVTNGNMEMVRFLVSSGADINAANHQGDTPLIIAARLNSIAIAKYLLDHGAERTTQNKYQETAKTEAAVFPADSEIYILLTQYKPATVKQAVAPTQQTAAQPTATVPTTSTGGQPGVTGVASLNALDFVVTADAQGLSEMTPEQEVAMAEAHAKALSETKEMLAAVRDEVEQGPVSDSVEIADVAGVFETESVQTVLQQTMAMQADQHQQRSSSDSDGSDAEDDDAAAVAEAANHQVPGMRESYHEHTHTDEVA